MATVCDHFQEAMALHRRGEVDRAARLYEDILRRNPKHPGAWQLLGVVLHSRGKLDEAREHIERALSLCDTKAVYWNNYGAVLKSLEHFAEARDAFERAIRIRDGFADAWSNLGLMRAELGETDEAERALRYALRLEPRHADALRHLAVVFRDRGQPEEAIRLCRDSLAVDSSKPDGHDLLGELLAGGRRYGQAAEAYRRSLALKPESANIHVRLGFTLADLDETDSAIESFDAAAVLRPDRPMWRLRRLALCPIVMPTTEAVTQFRDDMERRLDEAIVDGRPFDWRHAIHDGFTPSFQLSHHGVCDRRLKEKFARLFAPSFPKQRPQPNQHQRIRVGFLNTRGHEGGFVRGFGGVMKRLDPQRFEVVGLVTRQIVPFCKRAVGSDAVKWLGFPTDIVRAGKAVIETQCDVIMHWHAGTDLLNYFLPFLPLAPVQCIGFGTHGTTGIANIDHFVSSRLFERGEEASEDYAERLVQFNGATAWQERPRVMEPATRTDFGLPASGAIYFCPQRLQKFHPNYDPLLRGLLDKDPTGHIVILEGPRPRAATALRARFDRTLGATLAKRVLFLPMQDAQNYYRLLSLATVVLDAPVYSASLTGYDASALGVPVVTLPGPLMVQRYATGLYTRMGVRDTVVADEHQYVKLAVRLGREADFRESISRKILERCDVLYEDRAVIREYETFFQRTARDARRLATCEPNNG